MYTSFDTSLWEIMWKHVVSMSSVQYSLPNGVVGREFVQLLTDELGLLAETHVHHPNAVGQRLYDNYKEVH